VPKRCRAASLVAALALVVASCASTASVDVADPGLDRLGRAIARAHESGTFRLRGILTSHGSALTWEGFVAGRNEQYVTHALGLVIESRRVDGVSWAHRLDQADDWMQAPSDGALDLDVLLRGHDVRSRRDGEVWRITLEYTDVDVLVALTHIPSVGPTSAEVTVAPELISDVSLRLNGGAAARLHFTDYGASLTVSPPTGSPPVAR
jgi:hypothetical protein